jgi:hypothetical protein
MPTTFSGQMHYWIVIVVFISPNIVALPVLVGIRPSIRYITSPERTRSTHSILKRIKDMPTNSTAMYLSPIISRQPKLLVARIVR